MTDTISIPLKKLLAWDGNVRKMDTDKGIDELAASIYAHGLLQSLVVRKDKRSKYAVVAGRRRLLALESLVESGSLRDRLGRCLHNGYLDGRADLHSSLRGLGSSQVTLICSLAAERSVPVKLHRGGSYPHRA
jgi:hypothetical protein